MNISSYDILLQKLDEFIRKYYKNQLIRGSLLTAALLLLLFLTVSVLEYFGHFTSPVRTFIFYAFLTSSIFILSKYIAIPLFKLFKLGRIITHTEAAEVIGRHFPEVKDKLLNTLQLKEMYDGQLTDASLIKAGIDQKISALRPIPFDKAINLGKNRKYIKYVAVPLMLILLIIISSPGVIMDSTARLVNFNKYYELHAPFTFIIDNDSLSAVQQEDYTLKLSVAGSVLPDAVYIHTDNNNYRLSKTGKNSFSHIFKNVQSDIHFYFAASGFRSKYYSLRVFPNPSVISFEVQLYPPAYTGEKAAKFLNTGDLVVPEGTKISWRFHTVSTSAVTMNYNDSNYTLPRSGDEAYSWSTRAFKSTRYSVIPKNEHIFNNNAIEYAVNVTIDKYPEISLDEQVDSTRENRKYFTGKIKDDYGFTALQFRYRFISGNAATDPYQSIALPCNNALSEQGFYYLWNVESLNIRPGDEIEYYFEVWDNDGVHGSKSTKSARKVFKAPTLQELSEKNEEKNKEIETRLESTIRETKDIQRQLEKFKQKLFKKKSLTWEDKQEIKSLLEKQKHIEESVEKIQRQNSEKMKRESEYRHLSEDIIEKQQQLQNLFEKALTDEMKELFRQMEELLDQLDKEKLRDMMNDMKFTDEEIEKELDRTLEIFKQLEFEKLLDESIDALKKLAKEQDSLSDMALDKKANTDELLRKQDALNKSFQQAEKKIQELEQKNSELEYPNKMDPTDSARKDIKNEMQNSSQQLSRNQKKNASKSQKNASQKMKNLSNKLESMKSGMEMQSRTENLDALRQLLENLVKLSFNQETLMTQLNDINANDPKYASITHKQRQLMDDASMIEDSIFALSKRNPQIESLVNREISAVNKNMERAVENLSERQTAVARSRQQMVMTSVNNLALLLDEILQQLQQQMSQQKFGTASCNKPGNGKSKKMSNMKNLQQQLNDQINKLKKKQGNQPNGKTSGQKWSKELVRLAAKQEAIRNEIQKLSESMDKDGRNGSKGGLRDLSKLMEETESDLINNRITRETIRRQKEIMTRLLEHEKAERERGLDKQRKSQESKNKNNSNPSDFFEYKRIKQKEVELLNTIPPSFNFFYRNKVNKYFNVFQD